MGETGQTMTLTREDRERADAGTRRYEQGPRHRPLVRLEPDEPNDPIRRSRRLCSRCSVIARIASIPLCGRCDELLFYSLNLGPLPTTEINHGSRFECSVCQGFMTVPPDDGSDEKFCQRHREASARRRPAPKTRPEYSDRAPEAPHLIGGGFESRRIWTP
jgi:ribosomal protein S27AE